MIQLTDELIALLRSNAAASRAAEARGGSFDPIPVIKLFNPLGAATWLATELDEDGDTMFGLADLGFGCPELGSFRLTEIREVVLPSGLRILRDIGFTTVFPLSLWTAWSRRAGSILWAETLLNRVALGGARPESPTDPESSGGG